MPASSASKCGPCLHVSPPAQEPAQDTCALEQPPPAQPPAPPGAAAPASPFVGVADEDGSPFLSGSPADDNNNNNNSGGGNPAVAPLAIGSGLSIVPPCPSPEAEALAVVSSGSSYGSAASSAGGDSQPGSAASHASGASAGSLGRAYPLGGCAGGGEDSPLACAAPSSPHAAALQQQEQQPVAAAAAVAQHRRPAPLGLPHPPAALAEAPKLAASILCAGGERTKYPRVFSAPQLEVPEGEVMIGAGRRWAGP